MELFVAAMAKKMVLSPAGVQFPQPPGGSWARGRRQSRLCIRTPAAACGWARWRRPPPAVCRRCFTRFPTAMPAGGCHPQHPADPPVSRGVFTAALDAALVCLPPGPDGQPTMPARAGICPGVSGKP